MLAKTFAAVRGRVRSEPLGGPGGQRSRAVQTSKEEPSAPDGREARARPRTAVGRVSRLFREVYEAERLNAGAMPLLRRPTRLPDLVDVAVANLEAGAEAAGVHVENATHRTPYAAWCDRERILKVLSNLLSNAIAATPPGGRVRIATETRGNRVVVSVSDEGGGLDPRAWPFLFGDGWKDPGRKGAGLGLSVARAIVQAHGGKIWCESTLGAGSTFLFTLPIAPNGDSAAEAREAGARP